MNLLVQLTWRKVQKKFNYLFNIKVPKYNRDFLISLVAGVIFVIFLVLFNSKVFTVDSNEIVINEVSIGDGGNIFQEKSNFSGWIEILNNSENIIELEGFTLVSSDKSFWTFPKISLAPHRYLVIWASDADQIVNDENIFANFTLKNKVNKLGLYSNTNRLVHKINLPRIFTNTSYGLSHLNQSNFCFFATTTPARSNESNCFSDPDLGKPRISHASGFYSTAVEISLISDQTDFPIIYTTDGTFPDLRQNPVSTKIYTQPFIIDGPSRQRPNLSLIETTATKLPVVAENQLYFGVTPKLDTLLDFGVPVRARSEDGIETTSIFFVGDNLRRLSLPVVSIIADPHYFFDDKEGIYVAGEIFERWVKSEHYDPDAPAAFANTSIPTNYGQRGFDWERPKNNLLNSVTFEFCNSNGICEFKNSVGIRIHGNVSRYFSQKSLRLYARSKYSDNLFNYDFFEDGEVIPYEKILLRNSGGDNGNLMFKDGFLQSLMADFKAETQKYQPSVLFINGEYWGIHNLREHHDEEYLSQKYNLDKKAIKLLDNGSNRRGNNPEHLDEWLSFISQVSTLPPGSDEFEYLVSSTIDIESFYDFLIAHIYFANEDSIWNNARWWKYNSPHQNSESQFADGKWRWMINDLDSAAYNFEYDLMMQRLNERDSISTTDTFHLIFNPMMNNANLQKMFVDQFTDHINLTFQDNAVVSKLDNLVERLSPEIPRHAARWSKLKNWEIYISNLESFLNLRKASQIRQIQTRFNLEDPFTLEIVLDPNKYDIFMNSIKLISKNKQIFNALYFDRKRIEIEIQPKATCKFLYWEGVSINKKFDNPISLSLRKNLAIYPIMDGC